MKAVVFHAPGQVAVEDRPEPGIESPGDAIVKVSLAPVCGSDLVAYRGRSPGRRQPGITGHEFVGTISAVGDDVRRLQVGQRVVSPFSVWCGGCFYCKQGLLSACERRAVFGLQLPGAQAEYVRVPNADAVLEALPDALSDDKAAFLSHILTGVYGGLRQAGVKAGDSIAVVGCGPTGLATILMARAMGAGLIFALDHHNYRLGVAESLGARALGEDAQAVLLAATGNRGADIAVEAVGRVEALMRASDLTRPWGTLLSLSFGMEDDAGFPIGRLAQRRVRFLPAYGPAVKNYMAPVINMLSRGIIDPSPLVSHTLPLSDAPRAYELLHERTDGVLRIVLQP
ncbi:MAG TPA: alcohol dehydrogenase catalytic domain-containing protein [Dehalococcoidia bacterium]|nr:alcohol dehydrogenase catalytic domain-containing protein [Dehalococcoidia bacterium]